jgi:hypothetical protein
MQPYMEAHYVNIAFILILNKGAVPDACRDWQHHTPVNHTLAGFRREFGRAQREQRIISSTTSGAGYHTVNVAEHYVQTHLPADGGFVTAVEKLVTTTSADRETVATLKKAIATLTDQLAAKNIWDKSKESEVKRLLVGRSQIWPWSFMDPLVPTSSGSLTRPIMTTIVGHMAIRLKWPTQVPTAPRKLLVARMKQPMTTSRG